jgi:hypothetical protein
VLEALQDEGREICLYRNGSYVSGWLEPAAPSHPRAVLGSTVRILERLGLIVEDGKWEWGVVYRLASQQR